MKLDLLLGLLTAAVLGLVAVVWPDWILPLLVLAIPALKFGAPAVRNLERSMQVSDVAVTTRVVLLILFGTLPLMLVRSHLDGLIVFLVYNSFVLALVWLDIRLSPRLEDLEAERIVAGKLSIGEANDVIIRLVNRSRRLLRVVIRDAYPLEFSTSHQELEAPLERRSEGKIRYQVTPERRGDYLFGDLVVRFRGILELIERQKEFPAARKVEVYPSIKNISRFELMVRRGRLSELGLKPERRRGVGTEFESLKVYVPGDEFRKIDWKASARKGTLISREYQSEINQSVVVCLDCSRPMGARAENLTLLDVAVNSMLMLGWQVSRKDDKLGLLTFSDEVHSFLTPKRGKRHYHQYLRAIYNIQPRRAEPDYEKALKFLMGSRIRRSLVIIITDLASGDAAAQMRRTIWLLSRKHLPVVISVADPNLRRIAERVPATIEETYQKVVAFDVLKRVREARKAMENLGVITLSLRPQELTSALLTTYLNAKLRQKI